MLFQFIDRALDVLADTVQYGPIEAAKINTSICPEAERSYREVNAKVQSAIDDAFDKFEKSADVSDEYKQTEEYKSKTPVTADQFAGKLMQETASFMGDWMHNLYKTDTTGGMEKAERHEGYNKVLDEDEEEMISNAMSEKGSW